MQQSDEMHSDQTNCCSAGHLSWNRCAPPPPLRQLQEDLLLFMTAEQSWSSYMHEHNWHNEVKYLLLVIFIKIKHPFRNVTLQDSANTAWIKWANEDVNREQRSDLIWIHLLCIRGALNCFKYNADLIRKVHVLEMNLKPWEEAVSILHTCIIPWVEGWPSPLHNMHAASSLISRYKYIY